jgi:hypothetical protein
VLLLPFFELLVSVCWRLFRGFFVDVIGQLRFSSVDEAWASLFTRTKARKIWRLALSGTYFLLMGVFAIVCIVGFLLYPNSTMVNGLAVPFGLLCLVAPLCALLRPILLAWRVCCGCKDPDKGRLTRPISGSWRIFDFAHLLVNLDWEKFLVSEVTEGVRPKCWHHSVPHP